MRGELYNVRIYIYSIGLIVCSVLERIVTTAIDNYLALDTILYHAVSLGFLILLFILMDILLKPLSKKAFVAKIVLGKKYIGGRWVEVVINKDDKISHITKMDITYEEDNLVLHGDCYKGGRHAYFFDSKCAELNNFDLTYVFEAKEGVNDIREDIGHLHFQPNANKKLDNYSGDYKDKEKEFKLAAVLIEDSETIKSMDDDFIGTVKRKVLQLIQDKHHIPTMVVVEEP